MLVFLRCVGQAVAARGLKALLGLVPLGEQIYEIAMHALESYREENRLNALRADVEQMVQASAEVVHEQARQIANEVLAGQPPEQVNRLAQYLTQVPASARQTLKRPDDLAGTTVPPHVHLQEPLQLGNLLPRRLARFQAGEPVPQAPQWLLVQLLGAGGFGEVWLAQHSFLTHQQRAYKFCLDAEARERLLRYEGEVVKQVMQASQNMRDDQNGIVPLLDAYLDGETPWLVYEYVEGGDLSTIVRQHAELGPEERGARSLHYLIALAEVIGQFHTLPRPIVHRDLKPTNILVKRRGDDLFLRVTDFGISHVEADRGIHQATISRPQASLGPIYRGAYTPIYASPQQKKGMKPDVRDDVHALGIIGWQLLLGDLGAERPAGKWRKRLSATGLPDAVLDVLESCWDDDPDERPANAAVLAERLRERLVPRGAPGNQAEPVTQAQVTPPPVVPHLDHDSEKPTSSLKQPTAAVAESLGSDWQKVGEIDGLPIFGYRAFSFFEDLRFVITLKDISLLRNLKDPGRLFGLQFRNMDVTDLGLVHLSQLPSLRSLGLVECEDVTESGLIHISRLAQLNFLNLQGCKGVTVGGLAHLSNLTSLHSLELASCNGVTNLGLAHLARLIRLQHLGLSYCKAIRDSGLAHLVRLTALQSLNIEGCENITDAGVACLSRLTSLRSLTLGECYGVTDAGLSHLSRLPHLQSLNLLRCVGVTDAGVAALKQSLPGCEIKR